MRRPKRPTAQSWAQENEPYSSASRWLHLSTLVLFLILVVTGTILYIGPLEAAIGERSLLATVHVYAGVGVLFPFLISLIYLPPTSQTRAMLSELSRWNDADRAWMEAFPSVKGPKAARFNAGQKIYANFNLGALVVMVGTGLIMGAYIPLDIGLRQGATFVHDIGAFALTAFFLGHLYMALTHPTSMRHMFARTNR